MFTLIYRLKIELFFIQMKLSICGRICWLMVQEGKIILDNGGCLGACLHSIDMRNNEVFVYYAGIAVNQSLDIPKEIQSVNIPESTYAVFKHKGPISEVDLIRSEHYWMAFDLDIRNPLTKYAFEVKQRQYISFQNPFF